MRNRLIPVLGAVLAALPSSAAAQELLYHLPRGTVTAGWQARLLKCPAGGNAEIATQVSITGAYAPGELVRINSTSPFLASRSVALTFHENGTLKTINAEGEGKGGAVVASLLKSAAGFISLGPVGAAAGVMEVKSLAGDGIVQPPALQCKRVVAEAVKDWLQLKHNVESFETRIAAGPALPALDQAVYERSRARMIELEKQLTLSTSVKLEVETPAELLDKTPVTDPDTKKLRYFVHGWAKPLDLSKWFDAGAPDQETGTAGFCVRFAIDRDALIASQPTEHFAWRQWRDSGVGTDKRLARYMHNRFVYLRPVAVEASVREATDAIKNDPKPNEACGPVFAALKKVDSKSVTMPQLSGYFILPLGAGAFESKASAAEFAADGRIVSISHKSSGAGQGIADALAGGLAAAETMRDSETKAIQRRNERLKAEAELDHLLNPSPQSEVETVQP